MTRLRGNPWLVLGALCVGFFMILLDVTIVNVAVPAISDGIHASLNDVLWVQSGYVLVFAVLMIPAGRLGDMFGSRALYLTGLVVFTAASAACGLARHPDQLIAARVVQGLGGALLAPQTLAVITRIFPAERRGAAFGVWGAVAGVATVAGPTLGGLLITYANWSWIFYLNVPVGVVAFLAALWLVPGIRERRRHRFDIGGTLLVTAGLFLVTYGLIEGETYHWGRIRGLVSIPLVIAAGVVVLALFVVLQYRSRREPLVPLRQLADRNFGAMNLVSVAVSVGIIGFFLPLTIYLQAALHMSALEAGLTAAPSALMSGIVAPVSGKLADRFGGRFLVSAGLLSFAAGIGYIAWMATVDSPWWRFLPGLLLAGLGMGLVFAPMAAVAMRRIDPRVSGAASGVFNAVRQVGSVLGSAAVGALLSARLNAALPVAARAHAGELPPAFRGRFVAAFSHQSGPLAVGTKHDIPVPPGTPGRETLLRVADETFRDAFVHAMRPTMLLPVAVLVVAGLFCLLVVRDTGRRGAPAEVTEAAGAEPDA